MQGKLCQTGSDAFSKEMLETDKCYMLDCDSEIFVWMGRQTLLTERRTAIKAIEVRVSCFPFVSWKPRFSKYLSFSRSAYADLLISNFHLLNKIPLTVHLLANCSFSLPLAGYLPLFMKLIFLEKYMFLGKFLPMKFFYSIYLEPKFFIAYNNEAHLFLSKYNYKRPVTTMHVVNCAYP